ncbi:ATP-binding protein [Pseudoduganella namucuonensis]|uniref:histidine kinase n=1 Tax=Pseudoduganella namucuonensis TaxID=1035707 RepID=A0A1I7HDY3_9BURK|nr:ATP-binding protein [Pseudoduganella namucuonensis]SFU58779.1 PAS domain S-box-containing protein [Pseudoduganella namucuonensis]
MSAARPGLRQPLRDVALQRKLVLVSILTAGAAMLAALVALVSYDFIVARPKLVSDLAGRMQLVSLNLDVDLNFGDRPAAARTLEALRGSADIHGACLFDARRGFFARYVRDGKLECDWPAELDGAGHRFHGDFLAMLAPVRYGQEVVGYLQVDYALPPLADRLRQYGLVLAMVMMTLLVGGILHALSVRKLVTRPLLALSSMAHRVTREQRYDLRAEAEGRDEVGQLAGAINDMLSTIAERDAALRRSQSLLENIVAKSSAVIYIKDLSGRYLLVNERFRQILPPGTVDPLGHDDTEVFPPATIATIQANDRAVLESGHSNAYEESVPDSTGEMRIYLSEKFPLKDEYGHTWALGGVSTDITERKRGEIELMQYRDKLEEQVAVRTAQMVETNKELAESLETLRLAQDELVRSEKLAALGSLVAGVAHELNTPIGNSLLAVSTLIDQTRGFQKQLAEGLKRSTLQAYVADIQGGGEIVLRNLHRAVDLVASFKQVAVDRATSQRRAFLLADLANEILLVLMPTFKKSGIKVRQEVPGDIEMDSYPGPFGQVLINLITNALSHGFEGREGGVVMISARAAGDGAVEVVVSDNGGGIAPENMGRIYDPFFTTKLGRGGSGLGLNIVYNIVYGVLDGKIEVESELGKGTRFVLTLPGQAGSTQSK